MSGIKNENPGMVTSDSLAGESIREGGSFAANSKNRGVSDQPSSSTTANTTDDSSATKINPAHSRSDRADGINAATRAEGFGGSGHPSLNSGPFNVASMQSSKPKAGEQQDDGETTGDQLKPKASKQDGGEITGDEPNASFTTDIGGKDDPGRAALNKIERDNAAAAGAAGGRATQLDSKTPYDALGGDTPA